MGIHSLSTLAFVPLGFQFNTKDGDQFPHSLLLPEFST
jgi:hypothetical protein